MVLDAIRVDLWSEEVFKPAEQLKKKAFSFCLPVDGQHSRIAWKAAEIGRPFFQERVPPFLAFLGHIKEAGGVSGELHQAGLAVLVGVHGGLDAPERCGGVREDFPAPGHRFRFESLQGNDRIDHSHFQRLLRGILAAQEPDFPRLLLAYHAGEMG